MHRNLKKAWFSAAGVISLITYAGAFSGEAHAYQLDQTNHVITVSPSGDYTKDARDALAYLINRKDKDTLWTFKFNPGKYYMTKPLYGVGLKNVDFVSNTSNPAMLIKAENFSDSEYLIYLRMSEKIKVKGFDFYGRTSFKNNNNPVWVDQGIYFGSCKNITIDNNRFYNFGNAALRVTTSQVDPVKGVNSFDTTVSYNTFNNVYQISTTSNDDVHGATARYWLKNNTIVNLRGSVKFASRTAGAEGLHILDNNINGSEHYGLEIDNYNDVEIRGNTLQNIKEIAVNIYTNPRVPKGFNWGDNFNISKNRLDKVRRAIRFSPDPSSDGFKPVPKNLIISENTISTVSETDKFVPAISVVNGVVNGVKVTSNAMTSISNGKYIGISKGSTNIVQNNNKADGKALDAVSNSTGSPEPSPSPPPSSSGSGSGSASGGTSSASGAPKAPSNLAAKYDGNLSVKLTWNDNASNETGQEVWGSSDGKNYSRIAQLYSNSKVFTHKIKKVPSNPNFYYKVRAVINNNASAMSNEAKVVFN